MKRVHIIIGILVCLLAMVSTASAVSLVSNDGSKTHTVSATISGSSVTISVDSAAPAAWISKVGYNVAGVNYVSITDNSQQHGGWTLKGIQPMFNSMQFTEYDYNTRSDHTAKSVTINFDGNIPADSTFAAHVQWGTGSAFFGPGGSSSIPEFPTVALPVAAILGLMFILQRRKEN